MTMNIGGSDRRRLALTALGVLVFAMSSAGFTLKRFVGIATHTLAVGAPFPDLVLSDATGHPVAEPAYKVQRAIVAVAKPTCPHCAVELGYLDRLAGSLSHKVPLVIIAEPDGASDAELREFLAAYGSRLTIYVDGRRELLAQYPGTRVPTLYFLDSGRVRQVLLGERSQDYLRSQIEAFSR